MGSNRIELPLLTSADASCTKTPSLNRFGADPLEGRVWCDWPHRTVVLTCDGTIVCGCGDAFNENPMGDARQESVLDIWRGDGFRRMRRDMRDGHPVPFCYRCGLMEVHPPDFEPPDLPIVPDAYPSELYVEPTIVCNLRCPQPACVPDEVYDTRSIRMLPFDTYTKVLDEVGPHLERMVFYNYGESFIHPDACRMIRYAKDVNPRIWIWTSTNGHFFDKPEKVRALVDSGIDEIQFSIDGATQEVYEQYRKHGRLAKVLDGIRAVVQERERRGTAGPWILWNYIPFRWNDSDEQMERARALAMELGVDRLTRTTTDQPLGMPSTRYVPGSPDYERIRPGLIGAGRDVPNAIRWRAGIQAIEVPAKVRAGDAFVARLRIRNEGEVRWPSVHEQTTRTVRVYGRMQPASGGPFGRPFLVGTLPRAVPPGETVDLEMLGFAGGEPGHGRLKVELRFGERWWFEELGGEPLVRDLEIVDAKSDPPLLELISSPSTVRAGDVFEVAVRAHGRLGSPLHGSLTATHRAGVGIRWVSDEGGVHSADEQRCYFEPPLSPGEVRELRLSVLAPSLTSSRWIGKLDLVVEELTWFADLGFEALRLDVNVEGETEPCRVGVEVLHAPAAVARSAPFDLELRVRNDSSELLDGSGSSQSPVGVGIRWTAGACGYVARDSDRLYFDPPLKPGEARELLLRVPAEALSAGTFVARVDVVKEHHLWFEDKGARTSEFELHVSEPS